MRDKVYIAGKMTGLSRELVRERFRKGERDMREEGFRVCNPERWYPVMRFLPYRIILLFDLYLLSRCDRIYLLAGWIDSKGATLEHHYATIMGKIVMYEK